MSEQYAQLKADYPFALEVAEPGFQAREIIPVGENLYDAFLGWVEDDGTVVAWDIGGQPEYGWDPEAGYGRIYRLFPDDRTEDILSPAQMGRGMMLFPAKAPAEFTGFEGAIFYAGQLRPGRDGAHQTHVVYMLPPDERYPEPFVVMSTVGAVNGGISGGSMLVGPGAFGPKGARYEGQLFCFSIMNCVIYRVLPNRTIEPYLVLDGVASEKQIMPNFVFFATNRWGPLEGQMIIAGVEQTSFTSAAPEGQKLWFWAVDEDDGLLEVDCPPGYQHGPRVQEAGPEFGPFGGQLFYVDQGRINLWHTTMHDGVLPSDSVIHRIDADGNDHVFATGLNGGYNDLLFDGDRLLVASVRKSYSTGNFHEPDGSLAEIRWEGSA